MSDDGILSAELLEELGGSLDDSIVITAKKKKQEAKPEIVSDEVIAVAKELSKRKKKKIEQIQKRKYRESQQSNYITEIKKYEINQNQRNLLKSTQDVGQSMTIKQLLKHILKKERAGLALSPEEENLLYDKRSLKYDKDDKDDDVEDGSLPRSYKAVATYLSVQRDNEMAQTQSVPATGDVLFSFQEICPTAPMNNDNNKNLNPTEASGRLENTDTPSTNKNNKSKKKKRKIYDIDNTGDGDGVEDRSASGPTLESMPLQTVMPVQKIEKKQGQVAQESSEQEKSSSSKKKKGERSIAASSTSIGSNLLSQLKQIKAKAVEDKRLISGADAAQESSCRDITLSHGDISRGDDETTDAGNNSNKIAAYQPHAIKAPVTAFGEVISSAPDPAHEPNASITHGQVEGDVMGNESLRSRRTPIIIKRPHEVSVSRMRLPICSMEQEIIETITANDVVIICGETGSGKSTQVLLFIDIIRQM